MSVLLQMHTRFWLIDVKINNLRSSFVVDVINIYAGRHTRRRRRWRRRSLKRCRSVPTPTNGRTDGRISFLKTTSQFSVYSFHFSVGERRTRRVNIFRTNKERKERINQTQASQCVSEIDELFFNVDERFWKTRKIYWRSKTFVVWDRRSAVNRPTDNARLDFRIEFSSLVRLTF